MNERTDIVQLKCCFFAFAESQNVWAIIVKSAQNIFFKSWLCKRKTVAEKLVYNLGWNGAIPLRKRDVELFFEVIVIFIIFYYFFYFIGIFAILDFGIRFFCKLCIPYIVYWRKSVFFNMWYAWKKLFNSFNNNWLDRKSVV